MPGWLNVCLTDLPVSTSSLKSTGSVGMETTGMGVSILVGEGHCPTSCDLEEEWLKTIGLWDRDCCGARQAGSTSAGRPTRAAAGGGKDNDGAEQRQRRNAMCYR